MICKRCGVKIDGKLAIFSYGKPGSLERLYSRVCRHTQGRSHPDGYYCINPCSTYSESEDYGKMPTMINHEQLTENLMKEFNINQ
jgi:hypothetical protein